METERETANAQLLREIVTAYSEHASDVQIESAPINKGGELMKLRVNRDDYPKVFGGMGRQINALSTIFKFIGARDEKTLRLVLLEPERGEQKPFGKDGAAQYRPEKIKALLDKILERVLAQPFDTGIYDAEEKVILDFSPDISEVELATGLTPYLRPIFHAIGRHQGRDLYLEMNEPIPMKK